MKRKILALILSMALPLPAAAQTHVIAQLGTAPLIGQVASTGQLQHDMRAQRELFETAASQLGLTPMEFLSLEGRIDRGAVTYVTIPRHLDAMSWRTGDRVHVLHDVVIPANTMGWEVDLAESQSVLALFIPNKCGNLSLLRKPVVHVARAVKVLPATIAVATPAPAPASTPLPPPAPVVVAAAPPMQVPLSNYAASTGPVPSHHFRAWPLLLLPIVAMFVAHGHSGPSAFAPPVTSAGSGPPAAGCPTPKP